MFVAFRCPSHLDMCLLVQEAETIVLVSVLAKSNHLIPPKRNMGVHTLPP